MLVRGLEKRKTKEEVRGGVTMEDVEDRGRWRPINSCGSRKPKISLNLMDV